MNLYRQSKDISKRSWVSTTQTLRAKEDVSTDSIGDSSGDPKAMKESREKAENQENVKVESPHDSGTEYLTCL